jgi:DNA-binding CsgD family transcriptional regulator
MRTERHLREEGLDGTSRDVNLLLQQATDDCWNPKGAPPMTPIFPSREPEISTGPCAGSPNPEDFTAMPPTSPEKLRQLRKRWLGGEPLDRAAAEVGLPVAQAELALFGRRIVGSVEPADHNPKASERLVDKASRIDEGLLRRLYVEEGMRAKDVAVRLGLTEAAVSSRLRRAGINRDRTPQTVTDGKVRELYAQGKSIRVIAAELGIHQRSVWRHLERAGVELRPRGPAGTVLSRPQLERLYVTDGLPLAEISRRFEVTPHVVARNLERYGIVRQRPPLDRAVLEQLYLKERLGIRAIAARLEASQGQVGRAPWSGGNESVVVILSEGAGGQATSSLCARSTSFGLSSCPVS